MSQATVKSRITALEKQIFDLTAELSALRKSVDGVEVPNYDFTDQAGPTTLLALFGARDKLLVIHNMGQACRYCTLWGDGFNGLLPHLESAMSVVLVSKDDPDTQRRFANARGWRFRLASHGGGAYLQEQGLSEEFRNMPGAVVYERDGERIRRMNDCLFGEGDLYCSAWNLLALAGIGAADWTPQYTYWKRPSVLEDGGENLPED